MHLLAATHCRCCGLTRRKLPVSRRRSSEDQIDYSRAESIPTTEQFRFSFKMANTRDPVPDPTSKTSPTSSMSANSTSKGATRGCGIRFFTRDFFGSREEVLHYRAAKIGLSLTTTFRKLNAEGRKVSAAGL